MNRKSRLAAEGVAKRFFAKIGAKAFVVCLFSIATSLDGAPLDRSRRIIVAHLTDLANAGDTYEDESRHVLLRRGKPPHLVRAGVTHLALALGKGSFKAYALDTSGARVRKVPCKMRKRRLRFDADVAADPSNAAFLYEITVER